MGQAQVFSKRLVFPELLDRFGMLADYINATSRRRYPEMSISAASRSLRIDQKVGRNNDGWWFESLAAPSMSGSLKRRRRNYRFSLSFQITQNCWTHFNEKDQIKSIFSEYLKSIFQTNPQLVEEGQKLSVFKIYFKWFVSKLGSY